MTRRFPLRGAITVLLLLVLTPAPFACGPHIPSPVFVPQVHPQAITSYVRGELGIVRPTFARAYLYVAYRHLSESPFSQAEQEAVQQFWKPAGIVDAPPPGKTAQGWPRTWSDHWRDRRDSFPVLRKKHDGDYGIHVYKTLANYRDFVNCQDDAFRTAVATFDDRSKTFGRTSTELQIWTEAQDDVFEHCSGSTKARIPSPPGPAWPPLLKADRNYQIAAAHFYAGNFDEAHRRFGEIAAETDSPWREIAPYLQIRASIRKGTLTTAEGQWDAVALKRAEAEIHGLLASPGHSRYHAAAQRLLGFIRFRLAPEERGRELERRILTPQFSSTRRQDMEDYFRWLDRVVGDSGFYPDVELEKVRTNAFSARVTGNDTTALTEWILTFQAPSSTATGHAIARWEKTRSRAWLVSALSKGDGRHPKTMLLLKSAAELPRSDPAFWTANYHRARLLMAAGNSAEARSLLDSLLAEAGKLPASTENELLALRLRLATTLQEFARFAPRRPVRVSVNEEFDPENAAQFAPQWLAEIRKKTKSRYLDGDSVERLNEEFSTADLFKLAGDAALPRNARRDIAIAAWTRAALLGQHNLASAQNADLRALEKTLDASLTEHQRAPLPEKEFVAALILMRNPGLQPLVSAGFPREEPIHELNRLRDNWWCHPKLYEFSSAPDIGLPTTPPGSTPGKDAVVSERTQLAGIETAPNYFGRIVLDYAAKHPNDPRVPEALHRVVRATRFGCTDDNSGKFSKAAFDLLHQRYPKSAWTKKTPHWFQ